MKKFVKQSTQEALDKATKTMEVAKEAMEKVLAEHSVIDSVKARKVVARAKMELDSAIARVGHIEVAIAHQSKNHNEKLHNHVGDIIVKETKEKKEAIKVMKKAEVLLKPPVTEEMTEKQKKWQQEKADKAEAKRIEREAKKTLVEEIRKAKAVIAHAKAEARKAEKEEEREARLEDMRLVALGVLPTEAKSMIEQREACYTLLDALTDEANTIREERNVLIVKARELKVNLDKAGEGLKRPMCSAKYRAILSEKKTTELRIKLLTDTYKAKLAEGVALKDERVSLNEQIKMLKKNGNAAVRPTIRAIESRLKKLNKHREVDTAIRELETVMERCKKDSFQIWAWDKQTVLDKNGLSALFADANEYKANMKNSAKSEEAFAKSKAAIRKLEDMVAKGQPLNLSVLDARASRLQQNMLSMCMKIDTEAESVRDEWISIEHGIFTELKPSWKLFANKKAEGEKLAREFVAKVFELLDNVIVRWWDNNETMYHGLYSSASHQKKEKLVSCKEELMNVHECLVWFGKTKQDVINSTLTGAEIWKMRANLARPIAFALHTKDGKTIYLHNIYVVKDRKKNYHHDNALLIGGNHKDGPYEYCETDNKVTLGDGAILAVVELDHNAEQGGGTGVKGMIVGSEDAVAVAEQKRGKKINLPEGKYIVMGDGCFKFDKLYDSYDEFAAVMDEMAEQYPGINQVYALRESEEVEDEEKIRKVSRSFWQQLFVASDEEAHKLAQKTVDGLNYKKTFEGLFASLAELGVPEDKRSPFANIVFDCPMILTNIIVQAVGERAWYRKQQDAMGNKLRTKGQYPYIMQDPVALIEVWLLGADPDDPELGVLKDGEVSVVGVGEGKEMVMLRYPANALTAKVVVNRPMKNIFGRSGNVAMISIHDDILIIQDGDVDGDEAGCFYDELLIKLVKRMRRVVKPPVIVFEHGDKAKRVTIGSEAELKKRMYSALHSAKEFDSVGKYANLARDCIYLAGIELKLGVKAQREGRLAEATRHDELYRKYLLWMAAASTGAIMAIDQVKGNAIDPNLIAWLDAIEAAVKKLMVKKVKRTIDGEDKEVDVYAAPYTQPFVKNDMTIDTLPMNPLVNTDELANYVKETTGKWSHDGQGFSPNNKALATALLDNRHPLTTVRSNPLTYGILLNLRNNYFNRPTMMNGIMVNPDASVFRNVKEGKPVGQADILKMYYRNSKTLEFRMQAKTVAGKKAQYYKDVHDALICQALDYEWIQERPGNYEVGHVFTNEEKVAAVVNNAIICALELNGKSNGIDRELKPDFAKFVLSVFEDEIRENIKRNNVDARMFMDENYHPEMDENVEGGYEEVDYSIFEEVAAEEFDASVLEDGSTWISSYDDEDDSWRFEMDNDYTVA